MCYRRSAVRGSVSGSVPFDRLLAASVNGANSSLNSRHAALAYLIKWLIAVDADSARRGKRNKDGNNSFVSLCTSHYIIEIDEFVFYAPHSDSRMRSAGYDRIKRIKEIIAFYMCFMCFASHSWAETWSFQMHQIERHHLRAHGALDLETVKLSLCVTG